MTDDPEVEREVIAGSVSPEDLMDAYAPKEIDSFEAAEEAYLLYRAQNKPYRRAFGRGEKWRKILLACGTARVRSQDEQA